MVLQDLYVLRVPRPFLPMFRARMQVSGSALGCWLTCGWRLAALLPGEGCLGGAWEAGCIPGRPTQSPRSPRAWQWHLRPAHLRRGRDQNPGLHGFICFFL